MVHRGISVCWSAVTSVEAALAVGAQASQVARLAAFVPDGVYGWTGSLSAACGPSAVSAVVGACWADVVPSGTACVATVGLVSPTESAASTAAVLCWVVVNRDLSLL